MIASRDGHRSNNGPNRRKVSRGPIEIEGRAIAAPKARMGATTKLAESEACSTLLMRHNYCRMRPAHGRATQCKAPPRNARWPNMDFERGMRYKAASRLGRRFCRALPWPCSRPLANAINTGPREQAKLDTDVKELTWLREL